MKCKYSTAKRLLSKIKLGWNLGNYLDAHDKQFVLGDVKSKDVDYVVNLWNNPKFNLKCLDEFNKIGINCLRLPVTWSNFVNINGANVSISAEAINHIKKIIDYALNLKFVVILDMHHDDQTWLKVACDKKEFKKVCNIYSKIWSNIAYQFKDYGEDLTFEGMNEVIDRSNVNKYDWIGKNKLHFKRLNKLYKIFIKSVRRYSLNNINRTLVISTYGAQIHERALKLLKIPKDNNIVVDIHFYSRHNDIEYYEYMFRDVIDKLIDKGLPVILGEIGTKKDCVKDWDILKTYLGYAKKTNLKCILWDSGKSRKFIDRETGMIGDDFGFLKEHKI